MSRKKLGEMLIEAGIIDDSTLRAALGEQKRWGGTLGRALVEMRLVDEHTLVATLGEQLLLPTVDLDHLEIPEAVLALLPGELCERHSIIPFAQPFKFIDVAMAEPHDLGIVDEIRIRTQLNVRQYLAGPKMIQRAMRRSYGRGVEWGGPSVLDGRQREVAHLRDEVLFELAPDDKGVSSAPTRRASDSDRPVDLPRARATRERERDAEIIALQARLSRLEALVERDEDVIKKLLALLVDKGLATRDEILERIR